MRRVLLTGASGFIGRACIGPLLSRGFEVHAASRMTRESWPNVSVWPVDLLDRAAMEVLVRRVAPSHLLHTAWDVTHGAFWTARANLTWLEASVGLIRVFMDQGGMRAVGVGTCAEYGWSVPHLDEAAGPADAATPYGRAKRALGDAFAAAGGLGLSTAWARLFFPYGRGDNPARLVPALMRAIKAGTPFRATPGTQVRDLIHVDDIGEALAAILDGDVSGPINLGRGEGIALHRLIMSVATQMGRPDLVQLGALPPRPDDPPELVATIGRLVGEVGFTPRIDLEEGVRRTVRAFLADDDGFASGTGPGTASR